MLLEMDEVIRNCFQAEEGWYAVSQRRCSVAQELLDGKIVLSVAFIDSRLHL